MSVFVKKTTKNKIFSLKREIKAVLANQFSFITIDQLLGVFLVAYFFQNKAENILYISFFYIIFYSSIALTFIFVASFIKNGKRRLSMCLGLIIRSIFLLLIIILTNKITLYWLPLAILNGIGTGLFYCAYNTIYKEGAGGNQVNKFVSLVSLINSLIMIISPLVFGRLIDLTSFKNITLIVFVLNIIGIILSVFTIENKQTTKRKVKINYLAFWKTTKTTKNSGRLINYLLTCFLYGFIGNNNAIQIIIIPIFIYTIFKSNFSLGGFSSFLSICGLFSIWLISRFNKPKTQKHFFLFALNIYILPFLMFFWQINWLSLLVYIVIRGIFDKYISLLIDIQSCNLINQNKLEVFQEEYSVLDEIFLNLGRIASYILLINISLYNLNNNVFLNYRILFLATAIAIVILAIIANYSKNWKSSQKNQVNY